MRIYGLGFRDITPMMENQMEKNSNHMDTGIIQNRVDTKFLHGFVL